MTDAMTEGFGKVALGGVVGFGLYLLVTGLGFGGGGGGGGAVSRPKDQRRLSFVMQGPSSPGRPMIFRLRDDDPSAKIYSLDEAIARVKAGGRADVNLWIRGDVIQGLADQAMDLFKRAGIEVWKDAAVSASRVAENVRGEYGHCARRGRLP